MDKNLSALCQVQVPRYTSYPTAPHFSTAVDDATYRQWLEEIDRDTGLSLYLHVPFCTALCHYCGCHTKVVNRQEPIRSYGKLLEDEIALVAESAGRGLAVRHIHWGGGTPSLMPADAFAAIVAALHRSFDLSDVTEHAIELDPRTVTDDLASRLAAVGVNRASLGVQEFSQHVQKEIGRHQPFGIVTSAMKALRKAGIEAINFDLMYGLPAQTLHDVKRTAALTAELAPSRIAVFGYAHVPWFRKNQKLIDESLLPDSEARFEQAEMAASVLERAGYVRIGVDHFARPDDPLAVAAGSGTLARNFQGYTTDRASALIAFGASAIGRLPRGYVQNTPSMSDYRKRIEAGRFATVRGIPVSEDDRLRGAVIERLMCDFDVDLDAAAMAFDRRPEDIQPDPNGIARLRDQGLIEFDGHVLRMTPTGRPFVRLAAAAFDTYLKTEGGRHSAAV